LQLTQDLTYLSFMQWRIQGESLGQLPHSNVCGVPLNGALFI